MADKTKIEWTDATWNPITGCTVVSPGCTNCYAMKLAGTRLAHHESRAGLTRDSKAGPVWTGEVRFNPQWLDQPLRWKKPRMIFVCAHGDLFAEGVQEEWLDQIFAVMAASEHTFQVLTKRPERMRDYLTNPETLARQKKAIRKLTKNGWDEILLEIPLPNVWLGVSIEDQKRADARIPVLLQTPAAVRWISAEPLIGPVSLTGTSEDAKHQWNWLTGIEGQMNFDGPDFTETGKIDWVVSGGESGADARPSHPDWHRQLRDQCAAANVPFFFKQWGEWVPQLGSVSLPDNAEQSRYQWAEWDDGRWEYWDRPQWCDELDEDHSMIRCGKRLAGRFLDSVTHDGFPEVAR